MRYKRILLGASLVCCLGLGAFVLSILSEVPFERLELYRVSADKNGHPEHQPSTLEAGSQVDREQLKTFFLFSRSVESWDDFLERLQAEGLVQVRDSRLLIEGDLTLAPLYENHCTVIYCYQHRMSFEEVPAILWRGLIGIEDYRFLDHSGVDPRSIMRAIITDLKERRLAQGGSTLTQQLVKNLFLTNEKTFTRKLKEMFIALYIERTYPKENIIEAYLNEVFWGAFEGTRIKGIFSASLFYFNKRPRELSEYEAAILIGLLKGPNYYHPLRHLQRLKERTEVVFSKLNELGFVFAADAIPWTEQRWQSWQADLRERTQRGLKSSLWKLMDHYEPGLEEFEQFVLLSAADRFIRELRLRDEDLDFALKIKLRRIAPEPRSDLFGYYSKHERSRSQALNKEFHQIGSLLKPIVVQQFLALGAEGEQLIKTAPITLELLSGPWSPREVSRNIPAEVTLKEALQRSFNRPLIRLADELGFDRLEPLLVDVVPRLQTPLEQYPAQLLGAVEMSLSELVGMYETAIDHDCEQIDQGLEDVPLMWLSDPRETTLRGVLAKELVGLRYFGKTGTSNEGWDTVFVFFDGEILGGIWVGHEGARDQENPLRLFGSTTAYQVYQDFAILRGKRFKEFQCPRR